jgi:hypothetical protein
LVQLCARDNCRRNCLVHSEVVPQVEDGLPVAIINLRYGDVGRISICADYVALRLLIDALEVAKAKLAVAAGEEE